MFIYFLVFCMRLIIFTNILESLLVSLCINLSILFYFFILLLWLRIKISFIHINIIYYFHFNKGIKLYLLIINFLQLFMFYYKIRKWRSLFGFDDHSGNDNRTVMRFDYFFWNLIWFLELYEAIYFPSYLKVIFLKNIIIKHKWN